MILITDKLVERLQLLGRLPDDHDGEGAKAPKWTSVDAAIRFIPTIIRAKLPCGATLDDDGHAVFELENKERTIFASVTFYDDHIEGYYRKKSDPSELVHFPLSGEGVMDFINR